MGRPEMKKTDGHWGLSGPGWAAEWNQGGESGFLSIATAADDDRAAATKTIDVPGRRRLLVGSATATGARRPNGFRFGSSRTGQPPWTARYGEQPRVEEDNEMKLYFGWAFAWDGQPVTLKKGPAKLSLLSTTKDPQPRQIDVIVLTTDAAYRPRIKDRPANPDLGRCSKATAAATMPPTLGSPLADGTKQRLRPSCPSAWKLRTFRDKGFSSICWNVGR